MYAATFITMLAATGRLPERWTVDHCRLGEASAVTAASREMTRPRRIVHATSASALHVRSRIGFQDHEVGVEPGLPRVRCCLQGRVWPLRPWSTRQGCRESPCPLPPSSKLSRVLKSVM